MIGVAVIAVLLLAGAVDVQAVRERAYPPADTTEAALYLRSGTAVRRLTIAYHALAADVYWIRAIQYYGGAKRRLAAAPDVAAPPPMLASDTSGEYALLYPLLDITTTLDPRFNIAYRFGAVFLAEPYPGGPGRPDLAVALLEKGLHEKPDKWEYMEDIGFVHYWYMHDSLTAATWFRKAGETPGAPWWLRSLAATTLARGGDRQSSRVMWEVIRQSAENDWLRKNAEWRLTQLNAMDDIDALQQQVDEFGRRTGAPPADWQALVQSHLIRGIPVDPTRTPYELDGGRVRLSRQSPLSPLPEEPERLQDGLPRPPA
jgi:hypothetical protein